MLDHMTRNDLAKQFGKNLAGHRAQAKLSQDELGIRASLHRTEISQLERGRRLAGLDTLVKLAGALEIHPGDLLDGMEWSPGEVTRGKFL
jgi:transcriptional regulator with XRE-family HTH domain